MAIDLDKLVGRGGLPKLAPDLTLPSSINPGSGHMVISSINATAALTTVLSLSGKFMISLIEFGSIVVETMTIKLTIDGTVVWNDTFTNQTITLPLFGSRNVTNVHVGSVMLCEDSFLLEVQTLADTDIILKYLVRPIL